MSPRGCIIHARALLEAALNPMNGSHLLTLCQQATETLALAIEREIAERERKIIEEIEWCSPSIRVALPPGSASRRVT